MMMEVKKEKGGRKKKEERRRKKQGRREEGKEEERKGRIGTERKKGRDWRGKLVFIKITFFETHSFL